MACDFDENIFFVLTSVEVRLRASTNNNFSSSSPHSRMYSSIETPSSSSQTHQNQYQYHLNAFNIHSTANTKTSATGATTLAIGSAISIVRPSTLPSTDALPKQSSTNSNRNKTCSYGAYKSTCSNNNLEKVKNSIRTMTTTATKLNEKM